MTATNRRGFLRALGLNAARGAQEVAATAAPLVRATSPLATLLDAHPSAAAADGDATRGPERPDAAVPSWCLSVDELRDLVLAEDLGHRAGEVAALTRRSLRLVPVRNPAHACAWLNLDESVALADGPVVRVPGESSLLLAQISLAAPALLGTELAGTGWISILVDAETVEVSDWMSSPPRRGRIVMCDAPLGRENLRPMVFAAQLVLPRVWSEPVQALDLSSDEHDAYVRLRDRLAVRQGVEIEHGGGAEVAYHRVLGYPDETTGTMPADCALVDGDGPWRLLLQVSAGPTKRIYVWVRSELETAAPVIFVR